MKKVKIQISNSEYIIGHIQRRDTKKDSCSAVLMVHGYSSDEKAYIGRAKKLVDLGSICLTINLRGHGESSGDIKDLSRNDHLLDIFKAYKFLESIEEVNLKKIGIYGKSYGGYLTAIASSVLNPKSIAIGAPALYSDEGFDKSTWGCIQKDKNAFRQFSIKAKNNKALSSLKKYKGSVLLISFENDEVIPKETTNTYMKLNKNGKKIQEHVVEKSDHTMTNKKWDDEATDKITEWFSSKI